MLCLIAVSFGSAVYAPRVVDDDTFDRYVGRAPMTFLMVSRDDDPASVQLLPKFRAVAELMKNKCQFVRLDQVNSPNITAKYGLATHALYLFRHANLSWEYPYQRESKEMLKFLKRLTGPRVTKLKSIADVNALLESPLAVIMASDKLDEKTVKVLRAAANVTHDSVVFGVTDSDIAMQRLELEDVPVLQLRRRDDGVIVTFSSDQGITESAVVEWIEANRKPKYQERNEITFLRGERVRLSLLVFVDTSRKSSMERMHEVLGVVMEEHGENISCVYFDRSQFANLVVGLGFTGQREPMFCIAQIVGDNVQNEVLFQDREAATPEAVKNWVSAFFNNSLARRARSEQPRNDDDQGLVHRLVGSRFEMATRGDISHDVVVALYIGNDAERRAQTARVIEEVASEFERQQVESVRFYQMDAELNDAIGLNADPEWKTPVFVVWPAGKERKPFAIPGTSDAVGVINTIFTYGKTRSSFNLPLKYDGGSLEL